MCFSIYGKNDFAKISENLAKYTNLKIILDHQNNYEGNLRMINNAKDFDILATSSIQIF